MSIQNALRFIKKVREDEVLKRKIQASGREAELEGLVRIGAEVGFIFTVEELRTAFKQDWAMRWFHYNDTTSGEARGQS